MIRQIDISLKFIFILILNTEILIDGEIFCTIDGITKTIHIHPALSEVVAKAAETIK